MTKERTPAQERQALRDHYDANSATEELEAAEYDDTLIENPMITTSLRPPRDVLKKVRQEASNEASSQRR